MTRTTARDVIEHIERTIAECNEQLEATVDRLDAAIALRDLYFEAVDDSTISADAAIAAMTPNEVARARVASLNDRMTPKKETHQ